MKSSCRVFCFLPRFLPALAVCVPTLMVLGGCMFIPILADEEDYNTRVVDTKVVELQAEQAARMRQNPNISWEEYNAMNARLGHPGAVPPRPESAAALEKRLEAEERRSRR